MDTSQLLIQYLESLIAFSSISTQHDINRDLLTQTGRTLEASGLVLTTYQDRSSPHLVATTQKTLHPKLILAAHVDVVPATASDFNLTERDGRLYGRGVFDMKFAVAAYLQLVEDLKDEIHEYDFGIMLTSDEEIGGDSVKQLLDQGHGADVCILPDGANEWQIEASSNGAWFVKLCADGTPAHGSRPWEGQNAIDRLLSAIAQIREVFGELNPERCSITVSRIEGGDAVNQVPARASAVLDMRFRTHESYNEKRSIIERISAEVGVSVETVAQVDPGKIDLSEPHIAAFMETAQRVSGKALGTCHSLGSSDAHYFADKGIPTIVMRPTGGNPHAEDEWLDKAEFMQFYEVLKAYVIQMAKVA